MAYAATVSDSDLGAIDEAVAGNLWRWGLPDDTRVSLLNHSENTTYALQAGGRRYVLRVHRLGYHSAEAIAIELDWLAAVSRDTAIRTAAPVAGADGALVQPFATRQPEARHSVLFEFLDGEEPDESGDLAAAFEQLGGITAELHAHSRRWTAGRPRLARPVWDFEHTLGSRPIWGEPRHGIGVTAVVAAQLERGIREVRARLEAYGADAQRFGLIHADLRLANLLVHEGRVSVIDFDDCGYGWFLYDLGSALSFIEHRDYVPALVDAWVRGYERQAPLDEADIAMIPTFVMMRRLLLTGWLGSHRETDLARVIGREYTPQTCDMIDRYLQGRLFA